MHIDENNKADINHELARIANEAITFHEADCRISVKTTPQRTSWPMPRSDVEALLGLLRSIPSQAELDQIELVTSAFSLGWHHGRQRFIDEYDITMESGRPALSGVREQAHPVAAESSQGISPER